jgi:hypothetical protein
MDRRREETDRRREETWEQMCNTYAVKKRRFILPDVYASVVLHETNATPREVVVHGILNRDMRITKKHLEQVSKNGHVLDALCWLRKRFPDLLTRLSVNLDAVPPEVRQHLIRAEHHYRQLVRSVEKWLDVWAIVLDREQ